MGLYNHEALSLPAPHFLLTICLLHGPFAVHASAFSQISICRRHGVLRDLEDTVTLEVAFAFTCAVLFCGGYTLTGDSMQRGCRSNGGCMCQTAVAFFGCFVVGAH